MALPASNRDAIDGLDGFDPALVGELEPKLINLMQQSEALVALMRGFFQQLDRRRSEEFRVIAGYIAKAKEEIREMRPHDISQERIPTAGAELEAITRDTEAATHTIMNSAEALMGADISDPKAYKALVDDEVMKIFEACSFQDITGQRVSKVIGVLKQIEERVGRLANTLGVEDSGPLEMSAEEKRRHDLLLNGPAIGGPETGQDAIDAMFDSFDAVEEPAQPVKPDALAAKAPEVKADVKPANLQPAVARAAPQPAAPPVAKATPAPAPKPAPEAEAPGNSQDDIDSLFDTPSEDMRKTNSQDDIDALFD
ncbi:protein phosphatase CheZ [Asticcacaulis sp. EMRT-3]|uniref:protein phosphatase CheZ n=1 Tax=Asticcacaulis sp. EMRT-3 TaxID=3040349 RepID=UPI0024AECD5D|nr:protein phosphatase CheZ [Asticcacaulis sp. EMRT-3]MDI7774908.1 protein phosphatase CheZ [Asticcacaulis sp. EMRT-3]